MVVRESDASWLNQGGEGGTDFRDKQAESMVTRTRYVQHKKGNSAPLKTNPHTKAPIFYKYVSCRKIYKGSYTSGDFRDERAFIAGENDTSCMIGSARKSIGSQ